MVWVKQLAGMYPSDINQVLVMLVLFKIISLEILRVDLTIKALLDETTNRELDLMPSTTLPPTNPQINILSPPKPTRPNVIPDYASFFPHNNPRGVLMV